MRKTKKTRTSISSNAWHKRGDRTDELKDVEEPTDPVEKRDFHAAKESAGDDRLVLKIKLDQPVNTNSICEETLSGLGCQDFE